MKSSGHVSIEMLNSFALSTSSVATAASTPHKKVEETLLHSSSKSFRHDGKLASVASTRTQPSYSFDDSDRVNLPVVKMRTISNDEMQKTKHTKSRSKSVGDVKGLKSENTGRWTSEEHQFFLDGLQQYGKEWKKIADLIKSRTVVQIRTHAQKYFQKVAKAREMQNDPVSGTFRSTAISTCLKNQQSKNRKRKKDDLLSTKSSTKNSTKSSKHAKNNNIASKRKKRKSRSKSHGYQMEYQTLTRQFNIDNENLLKLDLFRSSQPLAFHFEEGNKSEMLSNKFVSSSTTSEADDTGGGTSPTTAVTDLFASLETATGSMIGLDFLDADIDGYNFDSDDEEDCESQFGNIHNSNNGMTETFSGSESGSDSTSSSASSTTTTPPQSLQKMTDGGKKARSVTASVPIKLRQVSPAPMAHIQTGNVPTSLLPSSTLKSGAGNFKRMTLKLTANDEDEERILDSLLNM